MLDKLKHEDKVVWCIETALFSAPLLFAAWMLSYWFYYGSLNGLYWGGGKPLGWL